MDLIAARVDAAWVDRWTPTLVAAALGWYALAWLVLYFCWPPRTPMTALAVPKDRRTPAQAELFTTEVWTATRQGTTRLVEWVLSPVYLPCRTLLACVCFAGGVAFAVVGMVGWRLLCRPADK